jgi:ATP synthase F1 complex assembly factor 2
VDPPHSPLDHDEATQGPHLRTLQNAAYADTVGFLTTHVWPGISIVPVLEGDSLMPRSQAPGTREVVQGWIETLSGYELAGLERATLAGKSLLAAARLVVEWSEEGAGLAATTTSSSAAAAAVGKGARKFGVEEAAWAVSLEVEWQTRKWGEVEDTHDVEKEDLRRQLASAVLLISGNGAGKTSS